jgi:trimeric autotransporter adhesin
MVRAADAQLKHTLPSAKTEAEAARASLAAATAEHERIKGDLERELTDARAQLRTTSERADIAERDAAAAKENAAAAAAAAAAATTAKAQAEAAAAAAVAAAAAAAVAESDMQVVVSLEEMEALRAVCSCPTTPLADVCEADVLCVRVCVCMPDDGQRLVALETGRKAAEEERDAARRAEATAVAGLKAAEEERDAARRAEATVVAELSEAARVATEAATLAGQAAVAKAVAEGQAAVTAAKDAAAAERLALQQQHAAAIATAATTAAAAAAAAERERQVQLQADLEARELKRTMEDLESRRVALETDMAEVAQSHEKLVNELRARAAQAERDAAALRLQVADATQAHAVQLAQAQEARSLLEQAQRQLADIQRQPANAQRDAQRQQADTQRQLAETQRQLTMAEHRATTATAQAADLFFHLHEHTKVGGSSACAHATACVCRSTAEGARWVAMGGARSRRWWQWRRPL